MENIPFFTSLRHTSCVDDILLTACDVEYYCCLEVQTLTLVVLGNTLDAVYTAKSGRSSQALLL